MDGEFEGRFRLVHEVSSELFWIVSPDRKRTIYISPTYERIFGRPIEDVYRDPRNFVDAIHPDDRAHVAASLQREGEPFEHEYRIVLPDGAIRWIWDRGHAVRNEAGELEYYVGLAQDITDRKQLEERIELTSRATHDGLWDWDITKNIAWWSDAMYTHFDFDRGDPPTFESWSSRIHGDDRARVLDGFKRAFDERHPTWSDEYRFLKRDGSVVEVYDRAVVLFDDDGVPRRMVGTMIDITSRRELEGQLRQSQKMEAIGQLAGGVAHDFNNILQAAMLDLSMLRSTPGIAPNVVVRAMEIESGLQRAATLTRQLLMFSRREAMRRRPMDLNAKLVEIARLLRRTIGEDIAFHLDLAPGTVPIDADPGMIDQVLLNLVLNARDAMPSGGTLSVETTLAGSSACLVVRDTGVGIEHASLPRIFEPFFTTKEAGRGTGLGLATVHGIVEQHGGRIEVDSTPGMGTTFRVYLPATTAAALEGPAEPELGPVRGRETILLVEDEAAVRRALREIIERAGYTVVEAESGALALSSYGRARIDLVVTDLVMPHGMSGRDLIDQLEKRDPALRAIFITGHARNLDAGTRHEVLHKPIGADQLLGRIRASLDRAVTG
jgi:PAS domain S-box-containing protein